MSLETVTPAAGEASPAVPDAAPIWSHTPGGDGPLSPRDAARSLIDARRKRDAQPEPTGAEPAAEEPKESTAQAEDAAPPETADPGETTERAEPEVELPPIEPPRSWKKDAKEAFKLLPPALQKDVAELERSREVETRRLQNEAAEQRKVMDTERQKVEQARQHYDQALPALLQEVVNQQAGEFSDIKTMEDVTRLANDDWPRYVRWDAKQKQIAAVQMQMQDSQKRQTEEAQKVWAEFVQKEEQLAAEKIPELADPAKAKTLQDSAVAILRDVGFADQELADFYHGKRGLSLRDHRMQLLIRDAVKFRTAEKALRTAPPKPVPPVQRPGVGSSRPNASEERIKTLTQQLDGATGTKAARIAAELTAERRRAAAR